MVQLGAIPIADVRQALIYTPLALLLTLATWISIDYARVLKQRQRLPP